MSRWVCRYTVVQVTVDTRGGQWNAAPRAGAIGGCELPSAGSRDQACVFLKSSPDP